MLEIILLVFLTRRLATMATAIGRAKAWAVLAPVLWIVAEIIGFLMADVFGAEGVEAMMIAIFFGAVGGGVAWLVVGSLSPASWMADDESAMSIE